MNLASFCSSPLCIVTRPADNLQRLVPRSVRVVAPNRGSSRHCCDHDLIPYQCSPSILHSFTGASPFTATKVKSLLRFFCSSVRACEWLFSTGGTPKPHSVCTARTQQSRVVLDVSSEAPAIYCRHGLNGIHRTCTRNLTGTGIL